MRQLFLFLLLFCAIGARAAGSNDAKTEMERGTQTKRNIVFIRRGGQALKLHLVRPAALPKKLLPVLIWVHGGLWRSGDAAKMPPLLFSLARRGYACASVEFRSSEEAIFPAQLDDLRAAARFLRQKAGDFSLDGGKIGVAGISTGAHLAALLALSGGANCAIDLCGPSDLTALNKGSRLDWNTSDGAVFELLGGLASEKVALARAASPLFCVGSHPPPFLILHGQEDSLVAVSQSEALFQRLQGAGGAVTYRIYRGEEHGMSGAGADIEAEVAEFLAKRLPR